MKKLLKLLLIMPFVTGCSINNGGTDSGDTGGPGDNGGPGDTDVPGDKPGDTDVPGDKPGDTDVPGDKPGDTDVPGDKPGDTDEPNIIYAQEKFSDYGDSIGDTWIKNYTQDELDLLSNLSEQTFYIARLDASIEASYGIDDSMSQPDKDIFIRGVCDNFINNHYDALFTKSKISALTGDILDESNQKTINPNLFSVRTPKDGHDEYTYNMAFGTGWLLEENDTHYFIASNHHVLFEPTKKSGDGVDEYNGEGKADICTVVVDHTNELVTTSIDNNIGNDGVVLNGRNSTNLNTKYDRLDFGVVAIKKDKFVSNNSLRAPIKLDTNINFDNATSQLKSNNYYTYGYPAGVPRYNKTTKGEWNGLAGWKNSDDISSTTNIGNTHWRYDGFFFDFHSTGGSSGSPIVNKDGKLSFINAVGTKDPNWASATYGRPSDSVWEQHRNGGLPAYQLIDIIKNNVCTTNTYNWTICNEI